jgi:hypothetical protein
VTRCVCKEIAQNVAQPVFCQIKYTSCLVEKGSSRIFATSVIFKILPKENKRLISENSPNLVTLPTLQNCDGWQKFKGHKNQSEKCQWRTG